MGAPSTKEGTPIIRNTKSRLDQFFERYSFHGNCFYIEMNFGFSLRRFSNDASSSPFYYKMHHIIFQTNVANFHKICTHYLLHFITVAKCF